MLQVETWQISHLIEQIRKNIIRLDPDYQRKGVWKKLHKVMFVDSIARKMPTGAITVFKDSSEGYDRYEVIDGKQRLTAMSEFVGDELTVDGSIIQSAIESDELPAVESELANRVIEAEKYSSLAVPDKNAFEQYKFPVFVIDGTREDAVNAFIRMNKNVIGLKPQEIRNALFKGTALLDAAWTLTEELTEEHDTDAPFFVSLGIVTPDGHTRMQDVQFVLECLVLLLVGPQHRRDTIDQYCNLYANPAGASKTDLGANLAKLKKIFQQIWGLMGGQKIKAHHFNGGENDMYSLVGALGERGLLTAPQMSKHGDDVLHALSDFMRLVSLYLGFLKEGETTGEGFPETVRSYASTFVSGQINSKTRRNERTKLLVEVLNDVINTVDGETFSDLQRSMIWAMSTDKTCARCGEKVEYSDFHAGHKEARALGGKSLVFNGQVEHSLCNTSAGAN